jgi:hypothetical protein
MKRVNTGLKIMLFCLVGLLCPFTGKSAQPFIDFKKGDMLLVSSEVKTFSILCDTNDYPGVSRVVCHLKHDMNQVTGGDLKLVNTMQPDVRLLVGSIQRSQYIQQLVKERKIKGDELLHKREKFIITLVTHSLNHKQPMLVIAGSDKRGTIYGLYELSRQIGVSPWYYWADVPIKKQSAIYVKRGSYTDGEPAVRYRGIFINDEAPSLTGWVKENFGDYNHVFYEKVFELILRLKGNFLWPAMWNNAFYDDDPLNSPLADEMGIIMGTSHHEPCARAQKEWHRYGSGPWNFVTNAEALKAFWEAGIRRMMHTEDVVTIGMRGDGDEPMSAGTNIALLEQIVAAQRQIIAKVTGKGEDALPQVWALYKEVQDYYDQGMKVPDDVTLLYSDDNWGNIRRLPPLNAPPRSGGYGVYYHFDYVGGPRNSKWLNVTQIQRVWEQMNLAWERGVDRIWIVNVGDIKPMEYPITFWMDMAWNPRRFNPDNLYEHTLNFCREQFGEGPAPEAARILTMYSKYNARVTPELLNENTYSLKNYHEFQRVTDEYKELEKAAQSQYNQLAPEYRDAYDELVRFPVMACANLYEMYYAVAMNKELAAHKDTLANQWADKAEACFQRDADLTKYYNREIAHGKWNHMMDQVHIGYTSWNEPRRNVMPQVIRVIP